MSWNDGTPASIMVETPCRHTRDEQWIIRKMAFEAAHDYIAELVGAKRVGKVVRLQRTNPLDPIKAELLGRLREHYAAGAA